MDKKPVPYIVYETELARMERQIKRMFVLCLIIFLALVGTNVGWIAYENQYADEVTQTVETSSEGGGDAYGVLIDNNGGDVNYGKSEDKPNN